jgi:hypothetical protein
MAASSSMKPDSISGRNTCASVQLKDLCTKASEVNDFDCSSVLRECARSRDGNLGRFRRWVTVNARADRGEGNTATPVLARQAQGGPVSACQQVGLTVIASTPDRTDGVNDVLRREPECGRYARLLRSRWHRPVIRQYRPRSHVVPFVLTARRDLTSGTRMAANRSGE